MSSLKVARSAIVPFGSESLASNCLSSSCLIQSNAIELVFENPVVELERLAVELGPQLAVLVRVHACISCEVLFLLGLGAFSTAEYDVVKSTN